MSGNVGNSAYSTQRLVSASRTTAYARMPASVTNPLEAYCKRKEATRIHVLNKYEIVGYIAAGTYGRVYKARPKNLIGDSDNRLFAIKKFKAEKEGEVVHYTGISQSACREMALCREINHRNVTKLVETILEDKCIYMVFEFAEHDLLQIIHFHSHPDRNAIPFSTLKSTMWQLLNGVSYLHQNWILHRDLKPANIMVTSDGIVKIGDLGLARVFSSPLQSLYSGDKVVVTIWYRAPELLLGGRHYTPAVDMWAVGCIFAELLALRPIFKGEEAKIENNTMSNNNGVGAMAGAGVIGNNINNNGNNNNGNLGGTVKKSVPFQRHQLQKIIEILGTPTVDEWPSLNKYPEFMALQSNFKVYPKNLKAWYHSIGATNPKALSLLQSLLGYDPSKRLTAMDASSHSYFTDNNPKVTQNVFESQDFKYPMRKIAKDDNDIKSGRKRAANEVNASQRKKQK